MSTSLEYRAVQTEAIPIEEITKNEEASAGEAALRGIRTTRILFRIVAVIRLLFTIWASVALMYWDTHRGSCNFGIVGAHKKQGTALRAIEWRLDEHACDNCAAAGLLKHHRYLFMHSFNILSTALLWAGAFMDKRTFLPICAILEIIFSTGFMLSTSAFNSVTSLWDWITHAHLFPLQAAMYFLLLLLFLAYNGIFLPKVLLRYYKHLASRDQTKERITYGQKSEKNVKWTQFALRIFAVVRLLITIAATFLILHRHPVPMPCYDYHNYDGFLSPDKPLESIQKRLDQIADGRVEVSQYFKFYRALAFDFINVAITFILWAGAFAKKKNCLPIYAILEIFLLVWTLIVNTRFRPLIFWPTLISLIGFCAVFLPMVLLRYYKHLDDRENVRKRVFNGEANVTITPLTSVGDAEQANE